MNSRSVSLPSIGSTEGRVLSVIRYALFITCNADIVLLLILAPFSNFFDFLFSIDLLILAVYVYEFVGVVGYYLQFEMRAVL